MVPTPGTPAAIAEPLSYPGEPPPTSILFVSGCSEDHHPKLELRSGRRLGQASLDRQKETPEEARRSATLNTALHRLNKIGVNHRVPVVAYGSNANVAQLTEKFRDYPDPVAIPVVKATIGAVDIAYSAHMSEHTYIPVTLIARDGAATEVFVLFLDDNEVTHLSKSEPNYRLARFAGSAYPLELESGERLDSYYVYVSRHGVLHLGGHPRFFTGSGASQPTILEEVLAHISALEGLADVPRGAEQFVERAESDDELRMLVSEVLREQYSSPMFPQPQETSAERCLRYGAIVSS